MTRSRVQINRSGVTLQRPSDRDPGEMYVNYADKQLGVIKGDKSPLDMLPVRYFSEEANYQPNDYIINGATIYRAKAGITAGPFDPAAWDVMTAILEAPSDGKIYGRSNATWAETITKLQFDSQISGLDTRIAGTESKNSEQDGRLAAIEGVNTSQSGAITTIQGEQTTQNNRMTTIEGVNTSQDSAIALKAPIASPTFTGDPKAPTPAAGDNDTSIATTAFVAASFAPLASPVFTGDPKAPTPTAGDNDTTIATTAFVQAALTGAIRLDITIAPFKYVSTQTAPPNLGEIRFNSVTTLATKIWMHNVATDNKFVGNFYMNTVKPGSLLVLYKTAIDYAIYKVLAAPVDPGGYVEYAVEFVNVWGAFVSNNDPILFMPMGGGGGGGVSIGDAPPASPLAGQMWWESDSGSLYIYYEDANSKQWVQVNGSNAYPSGMQRVTALPRNRIVNGAFQITQEFAKSVAQAANNTHIADQWMAYFATGGVPNFAVVASHPEEPDVVWWLRLGSGATPDTSIATADFYSIAQYIEGINIADFKWGTAQARPAVLRFKAWSNIAGTFCVSVRTPAVGRSFVKNCVIAANTVTEYVIPIPASTTGTWPTDNNAGLRVNFTVMAGTTYNGGTDNQWVDASWIATPQCSNWMSAASQYLDIANVGLYLDPDNTGLPPPWQMPDEAEELRACERYYEKSYITAANPGAANQIGGMIYFNAHAASVKYNVRFATRKRVATVAMAGFSYITGASGMYRDVTAGVDRAVTLTSGTGETGFTADFPGTAIGNNLALHYVANARM